MSQLNSLLESSAQGWKNMQSDAARLASKWEKTGLLEGIDSEINKNNMSLILENQTKQLVVEQSQTDQGCCRWCGCTMGRCCFTYGKESIWTNCCQRICFGSTNEFTFRSSIFPRFLVWTRKRIKLWSSWRCLWSYSFNVR